MSDMTVYGIVLAVIVSASVGIFALLRHCSNTEACDED
jgi:hypothetical protein